MADISISNPGYTLGEKVLCYHGKMLYEAKIIRTRPAQPVSDANSEGAKQVNTQNPGLFEYFVHYNGWNKKYDDWVADECLLKHTEENLKKQAELDKSVTIPQTRTTKKTISTRGAPIHSQQSEETDRRASVNSESNDATSEAKQESTPTVAPAATPPVTPAATTKEIKLSHSRAAKRNHRAAESSETTDTVKAESECGAPAVAEKTQPAALRPPPVCPAKKPAIAVELPLSVKAWITDDTDLLLRERLIAKLPARVTVTDILAQYVASRPEVLPPNASPDAINRDLASEIANGIREYFNASLGSFLLYKFERPQYSDLLESHKDKSMAELYGASHLFRLFVVFVSLLERTRLPEDVQRRAVEHISDLISFLAERLDSQAPVTPGAGATGALLSLDDYQPTTPEYQRRANC